MATALVAASTAVVTGLVGVPPIASASPAPTGQSSTGSTLDRAIGRLLASPNGPLGVIAVVDRGGDIDIHSAGTSRPGASTPITVGDHLRLASVSKAFSGAVALSLVAQGTLHLSDTVGTWLPTLPHQWSEVTLTQLLQHTSGIQDFSQTTAFLDALLADPTTAPAPAVLLTYSQKKLLFTPGTRYRYSNSDNIVVALIVQAATGQSYEQELATRVYAPLGLTGTSLPSGVAVPAPYAPGYQADPPNPPEDVTGLFAAGWSWASGGIVSTPLDATRFVRAYVRGATTDPATHAAQMQFRPGSSEPPGPGVNAAGLAIFRYETRCGTVYGHTGNTPGYTQFIGATADGSESATVSVNAQVTPKTDPVAFAALQQVELAAVCSALGG
jgi:D-alanyl-D-alanine carboxypeptidase